jgi:1-deoxy-D-xylulose-5-phosphate synthase
MLAVDLNQPSSIRYPKANAETMAGERTPVELGRSETLRTGRDGTILCLGTLLGDCVRAADVLAREGLDIGVVNARFVKPIDRDMVERAVRESTFVITVEEGCLMGGFGSAVLETACDLGLDTSRIKRLGLPDSFVEHGERQEVLADLGLDTAGIARTCREMAERCSVAPHHHGDDGAVIA